MKILFQLNFKEQFKARKNITLLCNLYEEYTIRRILLS